MRHVIIGGGPAGVVAAETLRKADSSADITMLCGEGEPPYSRMAIPYLLTGIINEEGTYLRHDKDHYDKLRIKLITALEAGLDSLDGAWLARIESAQISRPRDAKLQYLAGMACLSRQLWGKAQQLLSEAAPALQDRTLHRNAWRALAVLAEQRGDEAAVIEACKRAAEL